MMRLLIVDDSNIIRSRIMRIVLAGTLPGAQIVGLARDGAQAVMMFKAHQPDVVTMDLTMPNMDGIRCIEEIMAINPDVPILVISALADKTTAIAALRKGARGFLNKPFTEKQLVAALKEVISDDE
jgi:two-component system, chemotaxis family, chemotaxis protein CheY